MAHDGLCAGYERWHTDGKKLSLYFDNVETRDLSCLSRGDAQWYRAAR